MKRVYVDLDGVLCDFNSAFDRDYRKNPAQRFPQSRYGFFAELEPLHGAIDAFKILEKKYDMWICTRPSVQNINSYSEKAYWLSKHIGEHILPKTVMICDKSLVIGDYLIDDQLEFGQSEFQGELLHFGSSKFPNWSSILTYLN